MSVLLCPFGRVRAKDIHWYVLRSNFVTTCAIDDLASENAATEMQFTANTTAYARWAGFSDECAPIETYTATLQRKEGGHWHDEAHVVVGAHAARVERCGRRVDEPTHLLDERPLGRTLATAAPDVPAQADEPGCCSLVVDG